MKSLKKLTRKTNSKIATKDGVRNWIDFFESYSIHDKNESTFKNMMNTYSVWGDNSIIVLNSTYLFGELVKISKNSVTDLIPYKNVFKLHLDGLIPKYHVADFNKAFSKYFIQIYFSKNQLENIPNNESNFLLEKINLLNKDELKNTILTAFKEFGLIAFNKFNESKTLDVFKDIEISQEEIFLEQLFSDSRRDCLCDEILKELKDKNNLKLNLELIAENIKPNRMFGSNINNLEKLIDFSNIKLKKERYTAFKGNFICLGNESNDGECNLESVQNLYKVNELLKESVNYLKNNGELKSQYIYKKETFSNIEEVIKKHIKYNWQLKSLLLSTQKIDSNSKTGNEFKEKIETYINFLIMNLELENKLESKKNKIKI